MSEHADNETGPGASLRQARERAGLSCVEVAEQLNLTDTQIAILEAEDYAALPGPTYVQGYLRSYARLLGLDAAALVAAYRSQRLLVSEVQAGRKRPTLDHGSFQRYLGLLVLLVVLVGLWAWQRWSQHSVEQVAMELPATIAPVASGAPGEFMPAPAALRAEAGLDPMTGAVEDLVAEVVAVASGSETDPSPHVDALPAVALPPAAEPAPQPAADPLPGLSDDRLTLRFSGDCWVQVKDASGVTLVAELKHADDVLDLRGVGPFNILLGYAPAVEVAFNGRPVAIRADDSNQTAALVVGNS